MRNKTNKRQAGTIKTPWSFWLPCAAALDLVLISADAFAAGGGGGGGSSNSVEVAMCNVILIMTGTTGKAIATVGIIGLGVGALFGKVTWNAAMLSIMSIGLIFGAASIVGDLGGPGFGLILGMPLTNGGGGGGGGNNNASYGNFQFDADGLARSGGSNSGTCYGGGLIAS